MSYQNERDEFIARMSRNKVPVSVAQAVLRDAATVQRLAATACNRELSKAEERRTELAEKRIRLRLAEFKVDVRFGGDPRGFCTKLILPDGSYNSWGGREDGWGVPTRGY